MKIPSIGKKMPLTSYAPANVLSSSKGAGKAKTKSAPKGKKPGKALGFKPR